MMSDDRTRRDIPTVMPWHLDNDDAAQVLERALGHAQMLAPRKPAGGKGEALTELLCSVTLGGRSAGIVVGFDPKRGDSVDPWSRPWYQYPDVHSLNAACAAAGIGVGAAITYRANPAAPSARVTNQDTGESWARGLSGRWRPLNGRAVQPSLRLGLLLLDPNATAGQAAREIRQTISPWGALLERGREVALRRAADMPPDVTGRVEVLADRVRVLLEGTEVGAHRIVMEVDDADAMAASLDADADLSGASPLCLGLRAHAAAVRKAGRVRVVLPDVYAVRLEASDRLIALRGQCRPGQVFVVEPCEVAA